MPVDVSNIYFREAVTGDVPEIQRVRNSVLENRLSDPALVPDSDVMDYIFRRGNGWVCGFGNKLVGFSIISIIDKNVWALFIEPGFEGAGIGRQLHDIMLNWYFRQSKETLWLSTSPGTRAELFYRNAGWNETGLYGKTEIKFEMTWSGWMTKNKNTFRGKIRDLKQL